VYFELSRLSEARPYFLESAESISYLFWQASEFVKSSQSNKAIKTYEFLLSLEPRNVKALYDLARQFLTNACPTDAMIALERAHLIDRNDSRFWRLRGRAYMQLGQRDLAIADFEAAITYSKTNDESADAHHMLGVSLLQFRREYSQAIAELQVASTLRTNPLEKYYDYVEMGDAALERGYIEDAIRWLKEANLANPGMSGAEYLLGKSYLKSGQPDLAAYWLKEAIALESNLPDYYFWLAEAYLQTGDIRKAVSELQTAVQIQPKTMIYHLKLGQVLELEEKKDEALLQFRIALELHPSSREAQQGIERLAPSDYSP
jgi:tetratricopeptide (TPR) repeat protein